MWLTSGTSRRTAAGFVFVRASAGVPRPRSGRYAPGLIQVYSVGVLLTENQLVGRPSLGSAQRLGTHKSTQIPNANVVVLWR